MEGDIYYAPIGDCTFLLKVKYIGETLGRDNIIDVLFEDLKRDILVELERDIINHVFQESSTKGSFNAFAVIVLKAHTISNSCLYRFRYIDMACGLEMASREKKQAFKAK